MIEDLRERVAIQQATLNQDAFGQPIETWTTFATVWASVLPASGDERFSGRPDMEVAQLTHTVKIRFRTDLNEKMRLVWRGRNLDIERIEDPTGRRAVLELKCWELR